jgi:hypothetical protein
MNIFLRKRGSNDVQKNVGVIDMIIRLVVAVVLFVLHFKYEFSGSLDMFLQIMALYLIVTGGLRFCPFYVPFGISTVKDDQ